MKISKFRGDLSEISTIKRLLLSGRRWPVNLNRCVSDTTPNVVSTTVILKKCGRDRCFCFQNKINWYSDTLIQISFFYTMKINNFPGDLTYISAKKEALVGTKVSSTCSWLGNHATLAWIITFYRIASMGRIKIRSCALCKPDGNPWTSLGGQSYEHLHSLESP